MKDEKPQIYYTCGKFFDSEEEFWKYAKEWPNLPVDLKQFQRELDARMKEIEMNNEVNGGTLTNIQAHRILRLASDWVTEEENER